MPIDARATDGEIAAALAGAAGEMLLGLRQELTLQGADQRTIKAAGDRQSHVWLVEALSELRPDDAVLSEEGRDDRRRLGCERVWIVDPLDGTTNYVHGYPAYCVSIALAEHDRLLVGVIHDPVAGETYTATRGGGAWRNGSRLAVSSVRHAEDALVSVSFPAHPTAEAIAVKDFLAVLPHVQAVRRSGSTALNLAWLAAGRLDAFWVRRIRSWDVAAGLLLVREAGGTVVDFAWDGRRQPGDVPLDEPAFIAGATADLVRRILQWLPPSGERAAPPSGGLPSD